MRKIAALIAVALALAGCGADTPAAPTTSLTRAIAALRAGDYAAFTAAKTQVDAAKHDIGWQPGMYRCALTPADLQTYGEAALVDRLDQPALFKLSEEARFVYTAKVAGSYAAAYAEIADLPMVQNFFAIHIGEHPSECPASQHGAGLGERQGAPGESERRVALKDWMDALTARHGGAAAFDGAMHDAVATLDRNGFVATWPTQLQVVEDPAIDTYTRVRANKAGLRRDF